MKIEEIAKFARSLENVKEMHLLPYHRIGSDKYAGLGRKYEMAHISTPPKEQMAKLFKIVENQGLKCQIGGQPICRTSKTSRELFRNLFPASR